jgi:hypothetical protein
MEGGFDIVSLRDAIPGGPVYGTNFVMDKCLLVGTANTQGGIAIQYTGVTIRNTIMVRPNTPAFAQGWNAWVARRIRRNDNPADTLNPGDPVEIYGNTMVNLMDDTTRDGRPWRWIRISTCSRPSASRTTCPSPPTRPVSSPRTRACHGHRLKPWGGLAVPLSGHAIPRSGRQRRATDDERPLRHARGHGGGLPAARGLSGA